MLRKAQTEIKNSKPVLSKIEGFKIQSFFVPLCLCGCILLFIGCQEKAKSSKSKGLVGAKAEQSEVTLKRENEKLKEQNQQLKERLETLMGINKPARIEAISTVSAIQLTNRCGIYDKSNAVRRPQAEDSNDTSKKKMLMVYLRPIDDMGDVLKAAGAVKIELWNLGAKPSDALLKSWQIEPKELKKKWSGSLLTSYYKLPFDVNSILTGKEKEITLRVEFTDYLTGKILKEQSVIKP
jgi:FtsZ-binding cell division protein ZapB